MYPTKTHKCKSTPMLYWETSVFLNFNPRKGNIIWQMMFGVYSGDKEDDIDRNVVMSIAWLKWQWMVVVLLVQYNGRPRWWWKRDNGSDGPVNIIVNWMLLMVLSCSNKFMELTFGYILYIDYARASCSLHPFLNTN